ncbi:helix-turn-helix domain-containing protein [Desemzia sp. FAM 23991]|uniref:helix-turn-helix domain-containing protein n=1 Tax=Desemzia sp. FAM 23991 TaxID=3259521 RepID=UPI00388A3BE4
MEKLGEKIKKYRKIKGWSGNQLAQKSGVSQTFISQVERGKKKNPQPEILYKISNALGEGHDSYQKEVYRVLMQNAGYWQDDVVSQNNNELESKLADLTELNNGLENGFSLEHIPLQGYEQDFLKAVIKYMKQSKEREENLFAQWQEQANKDKD